MYRSQRRDLHINMPMYFSGAFWCPTTDTKGGSALFPHYTKLLRHYIRELVDSLCRDGTDAQYMQYLRKSRIIYIYGFGY